MIAIQYTRAGALLAAGLTAASTAGLEVAWPVRPHQRVATQRLQSSPELATFAALAREDPDRGDRALRAAMKRRLAHGDPRRATRPRPRAVFPVRGAVGFG